MFTRADIKVLSVLEGIRRRPGMYIGDTADGSGLHNMIYEAVNNAFDEALAGYATQVSLTLNADGSATIRDDGRGLPIDIDPREGISAAELLMTGLRYGGMAQNPYKVYGIGLCVVNALSTRLELKIWRDGIEHLVRFRKGVAEVLLQAVGSAHGRHGTELTFWPCPEIFGPVTAFDYAVLERRLRELAFLTP